MEDNFQIMDDYLKGNLSPEGVRLFNSKLKNEPEFEVEFREMKAIQEAAHASAKLSTMAKLQEIEMSISEKETTKIEFSMKKLVSVAASLVLIATVSYFTVFSTPDVATGQEIYSEYYRTYDNVVSGTERGEATELTTLENKAYYAYDTRSFNEAALLFADLLETERSAANYFYSGITNIELGNLENAKSDLNTVINHYEGFDVVRSKWFLAMALLKENNSESEEEAIFSLVDLSLGNSSYKSRASEILEKLGITLDGEEAGNVIDPILHPVEGDIPDGSELYGMRQFQFGKIKGFDGRLYRFFTDSPIYGLEDGDEVSFIALRTARGKSKKSVGRAYLLDKIK